MRQLKFYDRKNHFLRPLKLKKSTHILPLPLKTPTLYFEKRLLSLVFVLHFSLQITAYSNV